MYQGVFPILPTTFDEHGALDPASQRRVVDFAIDAGVAGICILANFSEQFSLADEERDRLAALILEHVAGRVPVIVTTSHYSSQIAAARSRRAQELGAAMVMMMPPYHGATIRPTEQGVFEFFQAVSDAISIPILVQDAPVSGVSMPVTLLARMARQIEAVQCFKIETPGAALKLRALIDLGGEAVRGPFDGEEGITLAADLAAGATGTMPSGMIPEVLVAVVGDYLAGCREQAIAQYERYLPLITYENRQCGLLATKALMREGGIIASEASRHPLPPLHPATRAGLVELAGRLDPLVLRWGR